MENRSFFLKNTRYLRWFYYGFFFNFWYKPIIRLVQPCSPLGCLLGYKAKLGVKGLWGGMVCGTALQTLILLFIVYRTNWNKEVSSSAWPLVITDLPSLWSNQGQSKWINELNWIKNCRWSKEQRGCWSGKDNTLKPRRRVMMYDVTSLWVSLYGWNKKPVMLLWFC